MQMKPVAEAEATEDLVTSPDQSGHHHFMVLVAGSAVIVAWTLISAYQIGGLQFWLHSTPHLLHLATAAACCAISAVNAGRMRGSLEYKLGQSLTSTLFIFGVYSLIIMSFRLFFSRPMLLSVTTCALFTCALVVWLKHKMTKTRIAVIAPLIGDATFALSYGRAITDPRTDLRGFDTVLVSLTETVSAEWARALSRAMLAGCRVRHVGQYVEELQGTISLDHFEFEHLPPNGIASYRTAKRLLDIALVVFILPVGLPAVLLSALAILLTMGAPVFFLQERIGLGGAPFWIWKLRTMRIRRDAEAMRATIVGDDRVTPVGRILRRFRIDELPQLWNVLRGDMSLIGPRPEAALMHSEYMSKLPNYAYRYLVRPGITGWAQVNAPPSATAEEAKRKLIYDLYYVKKLSFTLDLQIIARTFWTITMGGGAR
ncbi:MAG: sugar transferase [Gallionella sp.]|nr:sugar transferase [Gallionella sp.]